MVQISGATQPDRATARRREILEAASAVFRRRGLHATGMRNIAAELDMHVGNLYYYFRNKQEILAYCQDETLTALLELARETAASTASPPEKLRRLVIGHIERLNDDIPGSLAHLESEALEEPWRGSINRRRGRYEGMLRSLLRDGVESGDFRALDADLAAKALLGSLNWTVKWYRPGGRRSAAEIGEAFAQLFLAGVCDGGGARRETGR